VGLKNPIREDKSLLRDYMRPLGRKAARDQEARAEESASDSD
jgi:hypothetical protein